MSVSLGKNGPSAANGFSLAEAVIALGVLTLFLSACVSGIVFNRVASIKAKEQTIATDFLMHYLENVKAMAFSEVTGGCAINPLYNGTDGAPNISIPANSSWVLINTADFEAFHPDLLWIHNRDPQMQVTLTTESVGGVAHTKHMKIRVAWNAPLGRGGRLEAQMDLVRVKDL
jgi:hypothetical protein